MQVLHIAMNEVRRKEALMLEREFENANWNAKCRQNAHNTMPNAKH